MDAISNRKAWVIALAIVGLILVAVGSNRFGNYLRDRPVSVDNPVGTLDMEEFTASLMSDPYGESDRIVGHVWRIEGASDFRHSSLPRLQLGSDQDDVVNTVFLRFADADDESRFLRGDSAAMACRIYEVEGPPVLGAGVFTGGQSWDWRWIHADSCRILDATTTP